MQIELRHKVRQTGIGWNRSKNAISPQEGMHLLSEVSQVEIDVQVTASPASVEGL
jgi:hypothetical protein